MYLAWWIHLLHFIVIWGVTTAFRDKYVSNDACATTCTGVSTEVKYDVGRSYLFDVTSRTVLKIGHEQNTDVLQTGHAQISVHSQCEFSLKLTRTSLRGMDVGREWTDSLERYPLRFAFDDGEIKGICPHENDLPWAVNIKRAILSSFQTMHEGTRETDIAGDCPITIEKKRSDVRLILKTTKQLSACYREHDVDGIRTVPYRLQSKLQSLPILDTKQICERQIVKQNLEKASCTGTYRIASPVGENSFETLYVEQTLSAAGISTSERQQPFKDRSSIVFDHSVDDNLNKKGSPHFARELITELCRMDDHVGDDAASQFAEFVHILRRLPEQDIASLSNPQCGVFANALAACASRGCLAQLGNLINSGAADESVYSALPILSSADAGVMDSIATFIDRVAVHGLLPITSLVQSYCINQAICEKQPSVRRILDSIISRLPPGCQVGERFEEIEKAVIILKSIGNIGHEEHSLAVILGCIANDHIPKVVKLAAIDALRRKPCSPQRNSKITELFNDYKENAEIRIESFRQLINCADEELLGKIVATLQNETVNQVGSYVWSYLNTKRKSTNPGSYQLQNILKRFHISQRFKMDPFRFSRFYELGYFDKENNYGGHIDTSVVFEPKGYMPREIAFNLTIHLFGKSINILEFGARAEGLEQAEEELFGADGYITNPNGHIFREKKFQSRYDKLNQLKQLYNRQNNFVEDRVAATFYARVFGDDLYYFGFQKDHFLDEVKQSIELDKILARLAQQKAMKYIRHMLLFELSQTFPVLSGLSLHMHANATVFAKMDGKLKLNLVELLRQRGDADGNIGLRSSFSISRGATILLRAGHVASGAMLTSNIYAATNFKRQMEIKEGKKFLLRIDVPHKDILVAKMRHNAMKIESNRHQPLTSMRTRQQRHATKKHYCSSDILARILGIRACFDAFADFPTLEGTIKLEKTDPGLTTYQLLVERENTDEEHKLLMSVDTPGSQINRKMELNFDLSIPRKKLKMGIITPFKTIQLDGDLQEKQRFQDYATKVKLVVDNKEYSLDGTLKMDNVGSRNSYKLDAKSVASSTTAAEVSAEMAYNTLKPYGMIDFRLNKVFSKPIVFKTLFNPETPKYEGQLEYSGPVFSGKLNSLFIRHALINFKGSINGEYQYGNYPKQTFEVGVEQAFQKSEFTHHFKHAAHAFGTSFNKLDLQILSDRTGTSMKNLLEANYSGKKFIAKLDATRGANDIYKAVQCDHLDLDTKTNIIYQNRFPQQFNLKIDAETLKTKGLHASVEYTIKVDPKWIFIGNARFSYPGNEITLSKKIDEQQVGKYIMETHLQWDPRNKIDALSSVVFRPRDNEYGIESTVNAAGIIEPVRIKKYVKYQSNDYKLEWHAKQGSQTIYELKSDLQGQFGTPQQLNIRLKSEKFTPSLNYHVVADIRPFADAVTAQVALHKDGRDFGKADITFPKRFNLPNQKYRGEFNWNYRNQPRKAIAEYRQQTDPRGSIHVVNLQSDDKLNLSMQLDRHEKIHFICNLDKDRVRTLSAEFAATEFRWNLFEVNGHLITDRPLERRSFKTKAAFNYGINQVNIEGFLEANGERYVAEGQWRKQSHENQRHYIYSGKLETPQSRIHLDQQLQVEQAFTVQKAKTLLELAGGGKTYTLKNEIKNDNTSFSSITDFNGIDLLLKHNAEYAHRNGQRTLKKHFKYNEKEMKIDAMTINRDGEMKFDIGISSNSDQLKSGKVSFGCQKGPIYWNCNVEGNINDMYVLKGHEALSFHGMDIGYLISLRNFVNNEGKFKYDTDNQLSKYSADALLRNADKIYNLKIDVNGDRGIIKLQTPTNAITNAQVRVIRKGPNEFELRSEGGRGGKINVHIRNDPQNKFFKMLVIDIPESFELHLENSAIGGKQLSVVQLMLDPVGHKMVYGLESEIESEGDAFRGIRTTLKHPKRKMLVELLRPRPGNYALSVQPNVGGNRRPTVAQMTYVETADGCHWEGSFSDQALKNPLKGKIDYKRSGQDRHGYKLDLQTEFDYSGQPEKLFSNSLHIERSIVSQRDRRRIGGRRSPDGDIRFVAELKSTHLASNLNIRTWAKVDRRAIGDAFIPVHATLGLESKNLQKRSVIYLVELKTDGIRFTEVQLKLPDSLLKARINKMSSGYYDIEFFKDSESPSFVGELHLHDSGPELEFRDERLGEVKLYASAQMPNDYEGKVDVWHSVNGTKIQDSRFVLQMKENNLLKGNLYIRPAMENDIVMKVKETASKTNELGKSSLMKDLLLPLFYSHKSIANDIMGTLDKAINEWTSEQRILATELGSDYSKLVDEVERNYELIKEAILVAYDQAYQAVEQFVKAIPSSDFSYQLQQLRSGSGDFRQQVMNALKPFSELLEKLYKELEKFQKNASNALRYIEDALKVKDLQRTIAEFQRKFEQIDIIQAVLYEARKLSREYQMPNMERTIAGIEADRKHYETKAFEIYKKMKDLFLDKVVVSALTKVTSIVLDPVDETEIRKNWKEIVTYLRGNLTAEDLGRQFWRKYLPVVKRSGPGEYELEMIVPHGATSLKELLSDFHPQHFLALTSTLSETIGLSLDQWELLQFPLDTIYTYRPMKLNFWKLMSPYESVGYIIDGDRFVSFDGSVFAFHARCEYLLATDFLKQRFALLAIFSSSGRLEAIKAELLGEDVLLHKDGRVQVNGAAVSMPWQKIDSMDGAVLISVSRIDAWTVLKTYDGVQVRCNYDGDICEIVLPGRMHGRSNGLLGPNDFEPSNDRDLVDGTHNDQLNILAEHWAMNGACNMNEAREMSFREDDYCQAYFQSSSSPLRPCFSQIRSKPFEMICSNGGQQDQCTAASAYLAVCSNEGIDTSLPENCVKCHDGLVVDDEKKIEKLVAEHDVVFVVEEKKCMENYKDKIARMALRISQEQRSARFGWIGFGGEGIHSEPHLHYDRNDALLDISSFSRQIQASFEPVSGIEVPKSFPKQAVKFAAEHFPFRFGSAKSIVLVTCRKCSPEGQREILEELLDQDIVLHVLTLSKFKTSSGKNVIGMDAQQLYDERGRKIGQRENLLHPNDACSIVAQQSNGTVFSLKHGFTIAGSKVVPKRESYCFDCRCTINGLSTRNVCKPCKKTEPAELASYGVVDSGTHSDVQLLETLF